MAHVIADRQTLWLIDQILNGGAEIHRAEVEPHYFPGDDLLAALRPRGLPIGNLTSQFWANVYLNPLDHFVKRELKCPGYVRYVDDLLLFADDKPTLHGWRQAMIEFAATLRLTLHEPQAAVFPVNTGIPFLGWRVYPDHYRLKRRNGLMFQRRLARALHHLAGGEVSLSDLDRMIQGWIAHVAHGETWGLRRALLSSVVIPMRSAA